MELLSSYIPLDRRRAISQGQAIPDRLSGAALFADISGFMPLTAALLREFGLKRGAEALTQRLNAVYDALIGQVHRFGGSVITFSGDAITCWFDQTGVTTTDANLRATACGLAMQQAMRSFSLTKLPSGTIISLGVKVVVAAGPARRFRVGDPNIQLIDILAGHTLDRLATAEKFAKSGELLIGPEVSEQLGQTVEVAAWREVKLDGDEQRFALVDQLSLSTDTLTEAGKQVTPEQTAPAIASQNLSGLDPLPANGANLTEAQVRPWLLPPVYERARNQQAHFLAEIRPTVALFAQFGGLAYDQDEAAGEKLDGFIRLAQNVLAQDEGYLIQATSGDKGNYLYAAFGAPLAHDDDPARAVSAALALRSLPAQLPFISHIQIGISRGLMRVGPYGGAGRRAYGVLGDEVNVAARLMEQAQPGQIMVSQHVAEAVERRCQLKFIGPLTVKGKPEPTPAWLVLRRRLPTSQRLATIYRHALVGRAAELGQLEQMLDSALAGQGQLLCLEGAAGVGKSHLAAEFAERALARGVRVAVGAGESTRQGIAYHPWQQIFRSLFELGPQPLDLTAASLVAWRNHQIAWLRTKIEAINPDWSIRLPLLGNLLDVAIPDNETTAAFETKLRQEARLALAVELVQHWAKKQPLLLLVEDAHWLDEASRHLILALARMMAELPLLLLLVQRPTEQPLIPELAGLASNQRLNLAELSAAETAGLIHQRLQGRVSTLPVELIQARAQGNPFFSEELIDALRETRGLQRQADGLWELAEPLLGQLQRANCLRRQAGGWTLLPNAPLQELDLNLPETIQGTVLSRLDRLPELHKLTLKVAGVIGRVFEVDLLARAHPDQPDQETLLDQLKMMEARDLVRLEAPGPQPIYMFKHNITQEVAYGTMLAEQQRHLHQAVAEAMELKQPEAVERLAYHYRRGGVWEKTLFYLDRAARKTQREHANETALNYYALALELEERWQWRKGQVEIYHLLGDRQAEAEALEALATNPDAPLVEVAYLQGQYYEAISDYAEAQAATEQALAASREAGDLAGEVRCLAQLGSIAVGQGDYDCAQKWYSQTMYLFHPEAAIPGLEKRREDLGQERREGYNQGK